MRSLLKTLIFALGKSNLLDHYTNLSQYKPQNCLMTAKEFIMALPQKFNPEAVPGAESLFHFKIAGEGGGDFTASVKDGACSVVEGLAGEPKCVVSATADTLTDIVTGKANAQMAVFMGKLKISNLGEMMKFAKPFGLM